MRNKKVTLPINTTENIVDHLEQIIDGSLKDYKEEVEINNKNKKNNKLFSLSIAS